MTYIPHRGKRFDDTRLLIVSESAFSWRDISSGILMHPSETHPAAEIDYVVKDFDSIPDGFLRRMTMALVGKGDPTEVERRSAWDGCAYTIYVGETVGDEARQRPLREMYEAAKKPFLQVLDDLKPKRVIVIGLEGWRYMPDADRFLTRDVQAYRLASGEFTWCMAFGHTASSEWPGYATAHEAIAIFCALALPETPEAVAALMKRAHLSFGGERRLERAASLKKPKRQSSRLTTPPR